MLTLTEILKDLNFISPEGVLLGLFLTAGLMLVFRDWRFLILALLAQYVLASLILSRLIRPDVALIKLLIGAFVCPVLFLSARQVSIPTPSVLPSFDYDSPPSRYRLINWARAWLARLKPLFINPDSHPRRPRHGHVFRLLVALLMILVATTLSHTLTLPGLSLNITAAVYWLVLAGLVTLVLTEEPMQVGLGLFTIFTGFDLFYLTVERSLLLIGLWGMLNLLLALVIGYLIIAQGANLGGEI